MATEMVHGVLRAILLVPMSGEWRSNQLGAVTGSAILFAIAYRSTRWISATRRPEWLSIDAMWLAMAVVFVVALRSDCVETRSLQTTTCWSAVRCRLACRRCFSVLG